jgi:hypothetical protein
MLVVRASVAAAILRAIGARPLISVVGGTILPLLYDVVAATGSSVSSSPNADWGRDLLVILALGMLATLPGASLGNLVGGLSRRLLSRAIASRGRRSS